MKPLPGWAVGAKTSKRGSEKGLHILDDVKVEDLRDDYRSWGPKAAETGDGKVISSHMGRLSTKSIHMITKALGRKVGKKNKQDLVDVLVQIFEAFLKRGAVDAVTSARSQTSNARIDVSCAVEAIADKITMSFVEKCRLILIVMSTEFADRLVNYSNMSRLAKDDQSATSIFQDPWKDAGGFVEKEFNRR